MTDSSLYETGSVGSAGDADAAALMFGVLGVVALVSYIVSSIFMGMMFKKAGIPAWKAWVPIYNAWTFLEMGGQKGWISLLVILAVIPIIGLIPAIVVTVFMCIAAYKIGLGFGKEGWFVLLYIFLTLVWLIWLAVDKTAVWQPAVATDDTATPPTVPPSTQEPQQPAAM